METIKLLNPVMFLNDEHMSEDYQDIINDLLNYRKCLCIIRGAIIVKDIAEEDDISLTGIDAARLLSAHQEPTLKRHSRSIWVYKISTG